MRQPSDSPTQACARHEADVSAVLDGELDTVDLSAVLDHLVDCPACAEFYRRSRNLDLAVAASRGGVSTPEVTPEVAPVAPSEGVWWRIAERAPWTQSDSGAPASGRLERRRTSRLRLEWATRLAAVCVLAFGLWMLQLVSRDPDSALWRDGSPDSAFSVGSGRDEALASEMDERRFVALASEVLRADPRYHHEMLRVMKSATQSPSWEATVDYQPSDEVLALAGSARGGRDWQ